MFWLFVVAAVLFTGYAVYSHYQGTNVSDPIYKRVITSVGIAAAAIGAAIMQWFHGGTTTP